MNNNCVAIVDYGVGNLFNVKRAFQSLGIDSIITDDPNQIKEASRLLLPGVGAFETGMRHLKERSLIEAIIEFAESGRPVLGICLGMQLLMTQSEENGLHEGLNIIQGSVVRFRSSNAGQESYKIPQIGWNSLSRPNVDHRQREDDVWCNSILRDLENESFVYFVHSYTVKVEDPADCLALTHYGQDRFCSVLAKGNIFGCQFHPERSGPTGLKILENFISL